MLSLCPRYVRAMPLCALVACSVHIHSTSAPRPLPARFLRVSCDLRGFRVLGGTSYQADGENAPKAKFCVKFGNVQILLYLCSQKQKRKDMQKKYKHTSEEAAARERAHQFGQPGANPQGNPGAAVDVRKFLRWAETEATEEELRAYANDKTNPYLKRRTCELILNKLRNVRDLSEIMNQTHGLPKQVIEQTNLPEVKIVLE